GDAHDRGRLQQGPLGLHLLLSAWLRPSAAGKPCDRILPERQSAAAGAIQRAQGTAVRTWPPAVGQQIFYLLNWRKSLLRFCARPAFSLIDPAAQRTLLLRFKWGAQQLPLWHIDAVTGVGASIPLLTDLLSHDAPIGRGGVP